MRGPIRWICSISTTKWITLKLQANFSGLVWPFLLVLDISAKSWLCDMYYCAFHKHANSKVQKPPSQLRFSLPSIIITITSNEPWNTETHKTDRNPPITNHKPWPFEPVKVKFCFLRGSLRCLTAAKIAIVSWLLNFRIRMFVKSAVSNKDILQQ